jgi:hypothetical protein
LEALLKLLVCYNADESLAQCGQTQGPACRPFGSVTQTAGLATTLTKAWLNAAKHKAHLAAPLEALLKLLGLLQR